MASGTEIADRSPKYLGVPYSTMDCQKYVEKVLADCGINKNLAGSNAWYRFVMQNGWVGTPEECKKTFGEIPIGAFLFILKQDGNEPEQYKPDGIGNASHIGIYTGMTGAKMVELARQMGNPNGAKYNFGNGAMNSSNSRGYVCTSKFSGKSISGGWNRVGLWDKINYGGQVNQLLNGGGSSVEPYQAKVVDGRLSLREQPNTNADRLCWIPDGTVVTVTDEAMDWAKTSYNGYTGWVMRKYLQPVGADSGETVAVGKKQLEAIYDQIGDWLGLRG